MGTWSFEEETFRRFTHFWQIVRNIKTNLKPTELWLPMRSAGNQISVGLQLVLIVYTICKNCLKIWQAFHSKRPCPHCLITSLCLDGVLARRRKRHGTCHPPPRARPVGACLRLSSSSAVWVAQPGGFPPTPTMEIPPTFQKCCPKR